MEFFEKFLGFWKNKKQFYHLYAERLKQFFQICLLPTAFPQEKTIKKNAVFEKLKTYILGNHLIGKRGKQVFSYFPVDLYHFYQKFMHRDFFSPQCYRLAAKRLKLFFSNLPHRIFCRKTFFCKKSILSTILLIITRIMTPHVIANIFFFKKLSIFWKGRTNPCFYHKFINLAQNTSSTRAPQILSIAISNPQQFLISKN